MLKRLILSSALGAMIFSACTSAVQLMSTEEIKLGYKKHAALTQLHRWYLLYEEPMYGIYNQLDILDRDIYVKSGLGEAKGHANYIERFKELPSTWKNAHIVKSTDIKVNADGTLKLVANVTYANQGLLPENAVRTADLTYTTTLNQTDTVLPRFSSIQIAQDSSGTTTKFDSAYTNNRLLSLVHYWLALIEDPSRNAAPVKEILADGFALNFSSGVIKDYSGFKTWLTGPAAQVVASTHLVSNFTYKETGNNEYSINMDFNWNGILPNKSEMTAKTNHTWVVVDDPKEKFARIKTVNVKIIEPFAPKMKK